MANADPSTFFSKITQSINSIKGQFKQTASENNNSVKSISKDLGSHFSSQQNQINSIQSNIDDIEDKSNKIATKIENNNSILQQYIANQNDIMKMLKILVSNTNNGSNNSLSDKLGAALGTAGGLGAGLVLNSSSPPGVDSGAGGTPVPFSGENKPILDTIKAQESGGKYNIQNNSSTASGAYQFIDSTWKLRAQEAGVDTKQYPRAKDAPPEIQDKVADKYVTGILKQANNDVSKVPVAWFSGNIEGKSKDVSPEKIAQYQSNWLKEYAKHGGNAAPNNQQKNSTSGASLASGSTSSGSGNSQQSDTTQQQGGERQNSQTETPIKSDGGQVFQDQMREASIRKLPISQQLLSVLERAAKEAGVSVRVKSGGQPAEGSGGQRTGSTRHDNGNAADLDIYSGDKKLTPKNPEDLPIFKKFVMAASSAGATGIGAGEGYMGNDGSRMHVGFGSQAIWGAGGAGQNAASWLKDTVGGSPSGAPGGAQEFGRNTGGAMSMGQQNPMMGQSQMGMGQQNPMINPYASIGGMFGPKGAAIGGIAGILLPALGNILGNLQGDENRPTGSMQPAGPNLERAKIKTAAIDQAALQKENQQQVPAPAAGGSNGNVNHNNSNINSTHHNNDKSVTKSWAQQLALAFPGMGQHVMGAPHADPFMAA